MFPAPNSILLNNIKRSSEGPWITKYCDHLLSNELFNIYYQLVFVYIFEK